MANKEHMKVLRQGTEIWNTWRKGKTTIPNLSSADLGDIILAEANLNNAVLRNSFLGEVDFRAALLRGADLNGADLSGARLIDTDLGGADLRKSDLTDATIISANLRKAKLGGARIGYTVFANCDLSETSGLDVLEHWGPSTVGFDTIYRSRGKLSGSFLRGCGVPEGAILDVPALVGAEEGIQFYSCFISYSSKDEEFAKRLHGSMREARLRVWFAPEDIQGGKKLHEQIETAIRVYDKLLIVLSDASLQSEWVMTEIRKARKHERQSDKRKLFPMRLVDFATLREWECFDADSGKDLAVELREYFIPDFSNWKDHDSFESAFARLLKDLRSS